MSYALLKINGQNGSKPVNKVHCVHLQCTLQLDEQQNIIKFQINTLSYRIQYGSFIRSQFFSFHAFRLYNNFEIFFELPALSLSDAQTKQRLSQNHDFDGSCCNIILIFFLGEKQLCFLYYVKNIKRQLAGIPLIER